MLSLHIPGCVLHVQHISARTCRVSRAQDLSVAQATVLSSADTESFHLCSTAEAGLVHVCVPQHLAQCLPGTR